MESTFQPDDTRRIILESFLNTVCVGSTGRLGLVTHIAISHGQWCACGFGLDGKGVWTSKDPTEISTAEAFFNKLNNRFHGRLSSHECLSMGEIKQIADVVVEKLERHHQSFTPDEPIAVIEDLMTARGNVMSKVEAGVDNTLGLGTQLDPPRLMPQSVEAGLCRDADMPVEAKKCETVYKPAAVGLTKSPQIGGIGSDDF